MKGEERRRRRIEWRVVVWAADERRGRSSMRVREERGDGVVVVEEGEEVVKVSVG